MINKQVFQGMNIEEIHNHLINKLIYKRLLSCNSSTIKRIHSFDTTKMWGGDYDLDDFIWAADQDLDYATYYNKRLIGGVTLQKNPDFKNILVLNSSIILSEEFRGLGISDVMLRQTINTAFLKLQCKSVIAFILPNNKHSINLHTRNGFKKTDYQDDDKFLYNGKYCKQDAYEYSYKDYISNRELFLKYIVF